MKTTSVKKASYIILLLLVAMGANQCSLLDSLNIEEEKTIEKTIGSEGGSIESHTVEIVIPPGAFNDTYTIEVSQRDAQSTGFESDEASVFYSISGIPLNIGAPLQIKIEPEGGSMEGLLGIMGETVYIKSLDSEQLVYRFHEGTITGNQYQMFLEPEPENQQYSNETIDITVGLVKNYQILQISAGKQSPEQKQTDLVLFELIIKDEFVDHSLQLLEYLHEAYNKIQNQLGFDYSTRTTWPVKVTISDLGAEAYGYYNPSKWSINGGAISLNQRKLNEPAKMRVTIGHEFFHLVQCLYDPRWQYSKATSAGPWLWMDEATATWVEEKFSDNPDYFSPIWANNKLTAFSGLMEKEENGTISQHGYGMAAFIKYIAKKHGSSKIRQLYDQCKAGNNDLLNAINNVLGDNHSNYYPEFIKQYVLSQLYKDFTYRNLSGDWNHPVRNVDDFNKELKKNYAALSTRTLFFTLPYADFTPGSYLEIEQKSNSNSTLMMLFETKNEITSFIAQDFNKITLSNLQSVHQENPKLYLLIVNYQNQPLTDEEHCFTIYNEQQGQPCPDIPTFTYGGQTYNTVLIGSQCWMKENLNIATGNSWCYDNNPANCEIYGRLYDWQTALTACPSGWHLSSHDDWGQLVNYLGSIDYGGKLKATGTIESGTGLWFFPNTGATNETGFTALPGGRHFPGSGSGVIGYRGQWWTSTEYSSSNARYSLMVFNGTLVGNSYDPKERGFSVRCLKD